MTLLEVALSVAAAMIVSAPFAIWHFGIAGLRFGWIGLGILAVATLWVLAGDGRLGFALATTWLGAFSYVGAFALIAHASGQLRIGDRAR